MFYSLKIYKLKEIMIHLIKVIQESTKMNKREGLLEYTTLHEIKIIDLICDLLVIRCDTKKFNITPSRY